MKLVVDFDHIHGNVSTLAEADLLRYSSRLPIHLIMSKVFIIFSLVFVIGLGTKLVNNDSIAYITFIFK